MDAVSYPNAQVTEFIEGNLLALRIQADDPVLGPKFCIKWTPSLLILDQDGKEQSRTLGFISPEEFVPALLLGIGKGHFNRGERKEAIRRLDDLVEKYPRSFAAPEAIYLRGVSGYIETHDVSNLTHLYDRLSAEHPGSEWAMRGDPYRLLKK
jgi:hypothetical protein